MDLLERGDPDREAFTEAIMAAYKRHGEPDFPLFAAAFSAGWIAHRELPRGAVEPSGWDDLLSAIDNLRGYRVGERQQRPYLAHVDQVYALACGLANSQRGAVGDHGSEF